MSSTSSISLSGGNHFAFSQSSPILELAIGILFMAVAILLLQSSLLRRLWLGATDYLYGLAMRRRALVTHGLTVDYRKLDFVRIGIGFLATARYWELVQSSSSGGGFLFCLAAVGLGCAIAIMVGFFTPVASFLLMVLSNTIIDNYMGSSTLGSMVLSIMLLVCVLAPSGTTLSIDSLLARKMPTKLAGRVVTRIYLLVGPTSEKRMLLSKLAGMLVYYMLCLYSFTIHMHDPAWLSGHVTSWMMLSPVFNPDYSAIFDALYQFSPGAFAELGRASMYGMLLWYAIFLPSLFMGKTIRLWVIYWSLAFWLISAFILPLSYLGFYELFLWFLLFFSHGRVGREGSSKLTILFDDRCNLCAATVRFLKVADIFFICDFRPVSASREVLDEYGLSVNEALMDIVGVVPASKTLLSGYALYDWLSSHLVLLWPCKPFLWLGRVGRIGPRIYRYVADRRTRLFGVCERIDPSLALRAESFSVQLQQSNAYPRYFNAALLAVALLCTQYVVRLPFAGEEETRAEAWLSKSIGAASLVIGLGKINVFNLQDLSIGQVQVQLFVDGVPIASHNKTLVRTAIGSLSAVVSSDAERYKLIGYDRVNSRVNLRCNRFYLDMLAPMLQKQLAQLGTGNRLTAQIHFTGGASMADLDTHQYVPSTPKKICEVAFHDDPIQPYSITYHQEGIDAFLKNTQRPNVIRAAGANMIEVFPCQAEKDYFSALFGRYGEAFPNRKEMAAAILKMNTAKYGEFELECVIELAQVNTGLLQGFGATRLPAVTPGKCDTEISMAKKYAETIRTAYTTSAATGREMVLADKLEALKPLGSGDPYACLDAFSALRQEFLQLLLIK